MLDEQLQVLRGDFGSGERRNFLAAWVSTAAGRDDRSTGVARAHALRAVDRALERALDAVPESPVQRELTDHLTEVRALCDRDSSRAVACAREVFRGLAREAFASPRLAATAAAEALAELANALRADDDLMAAEHTLAAACRTLRDGVADPRVEARLETLRSALYRQTFRGAEACAATNRAAKLSRLGGDYPRRASGT